MFDRPGAWGFLFFNLPTLKLEKLIQVFAEHSWQGIKKKKITKRKPNSWTRQYEQCPTNKGSTGGSSEMGSGEIPQLLYSGSSYS